MNNLNKNPIKSFRDLEIFQISYDLMLKIYKEIIPKLPDYEKYDLKSQLRRSCKAIPRLIAEGYSKRHQKLGFQKYLYDALAECNETIVSLDQCRDLYNINQVLANDIISLYDRTSRQIYKLAIVWRNLKP
jgi:four helix bundle protein